MGESVFKLLGSSGLSAKDINEIIFSFPDTRRSAELAMGLGFDPETQLQGTLMDSVGNTGYAQPLMFAFLLNFLTEKLRKAYFPFV
ncbi:MAG: hypothetical protein N3F10_07350 [Candidatus Bathyarchaeota archaeon]|nr:hypothetical protein [Candidatus Bathyarchaeota archaeon]